MHLQMAQKRCTNAKQQKNDDLKGLHHQRYVSSSFAALVVASRLSVCYVVLYIDEHGTARSSTAYRVVMRAHIAYCLICNDRI